MDKIDINTQKKEKKRKVISKSKTQIKKVTDWSVHCHMF